MKFTAIQGKRVNICIIYKGMSLTYTEATNVHVSSVKQRVKKFAPNGYLQMVIYFDGISNSLHKTNSQQR